MTEQTLPLRRPHRWDPDQGFSHEWGIAARGKHMANPPLHIVITKEAGSGGGDKTWCGYGPAYAGGRNITGRKCMRCLALAWEEFRENADPDDVPRNAWGESLGEFTEPPEQRERRAM